MSKWKYVLHIKDEIKKANETELEKDNIILLEKIISELERITDSENEMDLEDLKNDFILLKDNLEANEFENIKEFQDEFNYYFNDLYDWADTFYSSGFKNCWIETF